MSVFKYGVRHSRMEQTVGEEGKLYSVIISIDKKKKCSHGSLWMI